MTLQPPPVSSNKMPTFIDVFAGGLSLGLLQAGWHGLFAIEKSAMAFETLKHNLVDKQVGPHLDWPDWIPAEPIDIEEFLTKYKAEIQDSLQDIDLLAGGPPCQGFSAAGRRKRDDERNLLFEKYLELVTLVRPKMILIENVRGFATSFTKLEKGGKEIEVEEEIFNADQELHKRLTEMDFVPFSQYSVMAKDFGVPQLRPRYILIAIRKNLLDTLDGLTIDPFTMPYGLRTAFLARYKLPSNRDITLKQAISDLELRHGYEMSQEPRMKTFRFGKYGRAVSTYQKIMRKDRSGNPIANGSLADSHRFPNHDEDIIKRFQLAVHYCYHFVAHCAATGSRELCYTPQKLNAHPAWQQVSEHVFVLLVWLRLF
jgi:DNA (cytosine-5)-methyltransferase 1